MSGGPENISSNPIRSGTRRDALRLGCIAPVSLFAAHSIGAKSLESSKEVVSFTMTKQQIVNLGNCALMDALKACSLKTTHSFLDSTVTFHLKLLQQD